MHDKWEKRDHIRGRNQDLDQKSSSEGEGIEGKVFRREKRKFLSREIGEKWERNHAEAIYKNTNLDGSRMCRELSSTNSQQINLLRCCRASVDSKRTLMDRTAIEQTETFSMDRESIAKLSRQILESFDGLKMW